MQYRVRDVMTIPFKAYRKKPIIVKARLITEDETVHTLEGTMYGSAGLHYLVIGIKAERYFVRKDIFEASYELVEE